MSAMAILRQLQLRSTASMPLSLEPSWRRVMKTFALSKTDPSLPVLGNVLIAMRTKCNKKYLIALFCVVVLVPPYGFGTAIVVILHGDQVWIAADSMQTDNTGTQHRYVCKTINEETFYWAAAPSLYEHPATGFGIEKLVKTIKSTKGTLLDV